MGPHHGPMRLNPPSQTSDAQHMHPHRSTQLINTSSLHRPHLFLDRTPVEMRMPRSGVQYSILATTETSTLGAVSITREPPQNMAPEANIWPTAPKRAQSARSRSWICHRSPDRSQPMPRSRHDLKRWHGRSFCWEMLQRKKKAPGIAH